MSFEVKKEAPEGFGNESDWNESYYILLAMVELLNVRSRWIISLPSPSSSQASDSAYSFSFSRRCRAVRIVAIRIGADAKTNMTLAAWKRMINVLRTLPEAFQPGRLHSPGVTDDICRGIHLNMTHHIPCRIRSSNDSSRRQRPLRRWPLSGNLSKRFPIPRCCFPLFCIRSLAPI